MVLLTLASLLATQVTQVQLESVLAPGDSPGLAAVTMRLGGSVAMQRNGDVVFAASLQGDVTTDDDGALVRWDSALDVFDVVVREGFVVDAVSNTRLTDASGFSDIGGLARGVYRSLQGSGVGALWVTGVGGAPLSIVSFGGAQCEGAEPGILQQGGDGTRVLMNDTGVLGFKDCGGVTVGDPGSPVTHTFTVPPQGATGNFTSAPLVEVMDDLGGVWLRGGTACPTCVGSSTTNLWRVSAGGIQLVWDSNAHTDLAPVVNISTPALNSSGDFAAAAFLTPNLSTGTTAIIRVTTATGDVTVLANEGDEIPVTRAATSSSRQKSGACSSRTTATSCSTRTSTTRRARASSRSKPAAASSRSPSRVSRSATSARAPRSPG